MNVAAVVLGGVALLVAGGFFVLVEFALLAARRDRLEHWVDRGRPNADTALVIFDDRDRQLAVCQVGTSIVLVLLGWLVLWRVLQRSTGGSDLPAPLLLVVALVVLALAAVLHNVVADVVPRTVALAAPERVLCRCARVQRAVALVLGPLAAAASAGAAATLRALGIVRVVARRDGRSSDELTRMVEASRAGGQLEGSEHDLLVAALSFHGRRVRDVMTDRPELVTVPRTATVAEAEQLVLASGHSRVLVLDDHRNQVIGFLHAKDLIALHGVGPSDVLPPHVVRVALWVHPEEFLDDVLPRMRRVRRHVAVVLDGSAISGLVTLEDLLEAIVGDIRDESDQDS